ncbi:uncharacterized protein [Prorops nasuta]|uniref:uncharacterized protein n=1 Tax=Prorops nasuta TaxID=863751 RepID=UPI0034CDC51B
MNNNATLNRVHVTDSLILVIRDFELKDAGIYRCHGKEGQETENKFNFRLEPIFKDQSDIFTERGNLTDWGKYREINLASVTTRFAVSRMDDLVDIRNEGIILEVISEWGSWGKCEKCIRRHGIRTRIGYCRLKRQMNTTSEIQPKNKFLFDFFRKSPLLPCKSVLLKQEFPGISSAIRYLPEFILEEKCKNCPREKKTKKRQRFKYKTQRVLAEGAHLTIACPEATMENNVIWKKDSLELKKGTGRSFRKKDPEARVMVDTFSTLYLIDVSRDEQGNYTCYVDKASMMQVTVIVVSKSKLLTEAFLRHMVYLAVIFLLTSFCYCGGLVLACRERDKFEIKSYEAIAAKNEEKVAFYSD